MIGKYFHIIKDGKQEIHGQVILRPEPGYYLIEIFDWLMKEATYQGLVTIESMKGWKFYDSLEAMTRGGKFKPVDMEEGTARGEEINE